MIWQSDHYYEVGIWSADGILSYRRPVRFYSRDEAMGHRAELLAAGHRNVHVRQIAITVVHETMTTLPGKEDAR